MSGNRNYHDVTVHANATLDTHGYVLYVCGTLLNQGTITDSYTGGTGGAGGGLGKGHDPCEHYNCNHQPLCTSGAAGALGGAPSVAQPGQNGHGGRGGGGGGGGGGAWWNFAGTCYDADGGDGGAGGAGGKGGGYLRIYAFHFDNQGVIHADAVPGSAGAQGEMQGHCTCATESGYEVCSNEHCGPWGVPQKDLSGGGGGGGGGGAGGNGGTIEVHCGCMLHKGTIRANGGAGAGGGGGVAGCQNTYGGGIWSGADPGCAGGAPNGGAGGAGENDVGSSGAGGSGSSGAAGAAGTCSFTFVPRPGMQEFSNPTTITIPDMGTATPYPSVISVGEAGAQICALAVELDGVSHTFPDDLDILLVGPTGIKVMLMSDAGGSADMVDVSLVFDDACAAPVLPDSSAITTGMYSPADYETTDVMPAPAPGRPYGTSLAPFIGTNPNGDWKLYVYDDASGDFGEIVDGWTLYLKIHDRGDSNCDGEVNVFDIDAFVIAMANPPNWHELYACDYGYVNDINCDGAVNVFDIDPFVEKLVGGPAGLIAHWCFDDGTADDCSGHGFDGYNHGAAPVPGVGDCCSALEFIQTDDYVSSIPESFDDSITDALSVAAWVNWYGSTGVDSYIFDARGQAGGSGVNAGCILEVLSSGALAFSMVDTAGYHWATTAAGVVPPNQWTHVAAVFDSVENRIHLLVDGEIITTVTAMYSYRATPLAPAIGNNVLISPARQFNGAIDELRVYGSALSGADVQYLMQVCRCP